ncbi:helix-turn-helix protein [Herbihabitans rhizosphaerae]|uniref:Helix-turn-helix protein n=1 Tax=Herbihabitans rhizosphaerae TaxID=1872711 RepID=A0A4Q7KKX2_9PSEU|nr:helix-turn-helix transcriptional regulator [Herbihabitans rhizosphaerae]RZS37145.1 helix-turn-helix protein [Herbihabitans rhizosphaerae]
MSGDTGRPTVRSRQVARELRRLRAKSGLSATEVGRRLGVSQSKISRIETGNLGLKEIEVAALLGLYHVPIGRRDEILAMVRQAAEPGLVQVHKGLPDQWQALIEFEQTTTALLNYQPLMIPGLLQTADYARAIITGTAANELPESEVDIKVAARLGRQAMLARPLPPRLDILLYEPVLVAPVGGSGVLARQLRHLADMAKRPRITIQVVPFQASPHPGLEGSFVIMEYEKDPTLVYLENRALSIFLEEIPHIDSYRLSWQSIKAKALTPKRSAELIARVARNLKERT